MSPTSYQLLYPASCRFFRPPLRSCSKSDRPGATRRPKVSIVRSKRRESTIFDSILRLLAAVPAGSLLARAVEAEDQFHLSLGHADRLGDGLLRLSRPG